jgi:hypothetical protein
MTIDVLAFAEQNRKITVLGQELLLMQLKDLEMSKNNFNPRSPFVLRICGYDSPYLPELRLSVRIEL